MEFTLQFALCFSRRIVRRNLTEISGGQSGFSNGGRRFVPSNSQSQNTATLCEIRCQSSLLPSPLQFYSSTRSSFRTIDWIAIGKVAEQEGSSSAFLFDVIF